jgi:hypothetical protein
MPTQAGVPARVCTPSSPVRERKRVRKRLNFYTFKGVHTLFTGERERDRERERGRERDIIFIFKRNDGCPGTF